VSFYTTAAAGGAQHHAPEKSQDRIGRHVVEYPGALPGALGDPARDRITTPLLCITGDQDPNVPASQSREHLLRAPPPGERGWSGCATSTARTGRPNSVPESIDFEQRILAWYDKYLKRRRRRRK